MRAHATQVKVWTSGPYAAFALADGVARPVFDTEHFTLARGAAAHRPLGGDIDEAACDDLFGGLPDPVVAHPKE
jgi:LmbE family N-acetylglucosaminyl deacetylase